MVSIHPKSIMWIRVFGFWAVCKSHPGSQALAIPSSCYQDHWVSKRKFRPSCIEAYWQRWPRSSCEQMSVLVDLHTQITIDFHYWWVFTLSLACNWNSNTFSSEFNRDYRNWDGNNSTYFCPIPHSYIHRCIYSISWTYMLNVHVLHDLSRIMNLYILPHASHIRSYHASNMSNDISKSLSIM